MNQQSSFEKQQFSEKQHHSTFLMKEQKYILHRLVNIMEKVQLRANFSKLQYYCIHKQELFASKRRLFNMVKGNLRKIRTQKSSFITNEMTTKESLASLIQLQNSPNSEQKIQKEESHREEVILSKKIILLNYKNFTNYLKVIQTPKKQLPLELQTSVINRIQDEYPNAKIDPMFNKFFRKQLRGSFSQIIKKDGLEKYTDLKWTREHKNPNSDEYSEIFLKKKKQKVSESQEEEQNDFLGIIAQLFEIINLIYIGIGFISGNFISIILLKIILMTL